MLHRTINGRCAAAIALLAFASATLAERSSSPEPAHALEGAALVAALRAGGLALEAGRLTFGRAGPSTVVRGYEGTSSAGADDTLLVALLASPPKAGTLRMITSHGNPFRAIAGPPHLEEGEAAVLKSEGSDFVVVVRVKRGDWASLAAAAR